MPSPLPGVSLDDPDLTRAVARAIRDVSQGFYSSTRIGDVLNGASGVIVAPEEAARSALRAVRAHLEEVGR